MKVVRLMGAMAVAAALMSSNTNASEASAWVTINSVYVYSSGSTKLYYLYADSSWGFTNPSCSTANSSSLVFDATQGGSKDWYAAVLAAKANGGQIQVTIDACSTLVIIQVGTK